MVMSTSSSPLPLDYRQPEVARLASYIRAGDSCSVVGVSGMAKSNLFRHLLNPEVREHYLRDSRRKYLFIGVDAHGMGELSEPRFFAQLLNCLVSGTQGHRLPESGLGTKPPTHGVLASSEEAESCRSLAEAVQILMAHDPAYHLVFLFDQFDDVYKNLPPRVFVNLRFIRDQNKYRISYLVFTRDELPYLNSGPPYEEFYELFSPNVLGLGPHDRKDCLLLLKRVSGRYGQALSSDVSNQLIAASLGHAGLLKAACMAFLNGGVHLDQKDHGINSLLSVGDVATECAKLWQSITVDERSALNQLSGTSYSGYNTEVMRRLRLKGLIQEQGDRTVVFSPLLAAYARNQRVGPAPELRIQAGAIRIDSAGDVWIEGQRMSPSLSAKELLFLEYLCLEPGRLRSKDEITAVVYPDEYKSGEMISDDALNAIVKRLRARIEALSPRNYIVTLRGKGYRLDTGG